MTYGLSKSNAAEIIELFGFVLENISLSSAAAKLCTDIDQPACKKVAFLNADCVNQSYRVPAYRAALSRFDCLFADGVGMRVAAKLQGKELRDNVNGTDLFPVLLDQLNQKRASLYLLGGKPDRALIVAQNIQKSHPSIKVVGHHHGYLEPFSEATVLDQLKQARPDVLLVGMGAPRQEIWIQRYADELQIPVVVGVGGLFDYYSGAIPRAPLWMRRCSVEWIWRLLMEPRLKGKRYLFGNVEFLWRAWKEANDQPRRVNVKRSLRARFAVNAWRVQDRVLAWAKRGVDVFVASLASMILSPLLFLTALAIRVESPGSVLFSQVRVGKNGREFRMYKFRSMYRDAEQRRQALEAQNEMATGVTFKVKDDPRITRVGRIIRKLSIDELPQLWNVIIGDMSLVGPRPPLPSETSQYSTHERFRLQCRPGITCIWQVSGRSDIAFDRQVEMDIEYIVHKSLWADIKILLRTIPAVLLARGAY